MIKFSFDPQSSDQIHYLDGYFKQSQYKKQISLNKFSLQAHHFDPVISVQDNALQLSVQTVHRGETCERRALENFIQEKYQQVHQATISTFSSTLFAGYDGAEMQVVIGMEHLHQTNAFLEQYLDEPIENILGKLSQTEISRNKIVEIGNLAAVDINQAKLIVAFLVFHLSQQCIEWAVCTGTTAVRYVLQQMGLRFHVLEKADPQVLGEAQRLWGSYYQQKPYVLAIDVAEALQVARQLYQFSH
ncbi:thermostable hemolysin [Acinetobacter sp. 226]|uniref:thermostable hemolysin n=1 Tax=Acinetobacter sp. 226 TaxID=3114699 RepID=UPI003A840A56